jgi:hypothetical protein
MLIMPCKLTVAVASLIITPLGCDAVVVMFAVELASTIVTAAALALTLKDVDPANCVVSGSP